MQAKGTATRPTRPSELAGLGRLTVDAVHGVTDLVEALHHTIASLAAVRGTPGAGPHPRRDQVGLPNHPYHHRLAWARARSAVEPIGRRH